MAKAKTKRTTKPEAKALDYGKMFLASAVADPAINAAGYYYLARNDLNACKSKAEKPEAEAAYKAAGDAVLKVVPTRLAGIHALAAVAQSLPEDGFSGDDVTRCLIGIEQAAALHENTGDREAVMRPLGDMMNEPMRGLERGIEAMDTFGLAAINDKSGGSAEHLARAILYFAETLQTYYDQAEALLEKAFKAGLAPAARERDAENMRRFNMVEAEELAERAKKLFERAKAEA